MEALDYMKLFEQTASVRMGGSVEEQRTAELLQQKAASVGLETRIEAFDVPMSQIQSASLTVDGREIPCKGYFCCGSGETEAPLYYLRNTDSWSLSQCRGKIVMIDGYLGYWMYQDLMENGAVGIITYDGNANYQDRDIDQRELRSYVHKGNRTLAVNINAKDAIELIRTDANTARIAVQQNEYTGQSHNVIGELPGEIPEYIVLTAHYDSTSLSQGAGLQGILRGF